MKFKEVMGYIGSALIGNIIFKTILTVPIVIILFVYVAVLKQSLSSINLTVHSIFWYVVLFVGFFLGVRAYHRKDIWFTVFKPSKLNLLVSFILAVALVLPFALLSKQPFADPVTLAPWPQGTGVPFSIISYLIGFYCFSCLACFVYQHRGDKVFKDIKIVIIILLILTNPLFLVMGGAFYAIFNNVIITNSCGIQITGFYEPSPARESGMQVNDIIIKIDETPINSSFDLFTYMNSLEIDQPITIQTRQGSFYNLKPNWDGQKFIMGVNITEARCPR